MRVSGMMFPGNVPPRGSFTTVLGKYAERSPDFMAAVGILTITAWFLGSCNPSKSMKKKVLSFPLYSFGADNGPPKDAP